MEVTLREKELFPPLKKYFKEMGYTVYAEVPSFDRGVDFVAVKGDEHIAVEMKTGFNSKVIHQARYNVTAFGNSYVAYPVKKATFFEITEQYWACKPSLRQKVDWCQKFGVGILQILPSGVIVTALECVYERPYRVFDFSQFKESDEDEAGLPFQKGVSAGYYELEAIKAYVIKNPNANWKEIYTNVQNHYSSPSSLAGSMKQWRGFSLPDFKESLSPIKSHNEVK